MADSEPSKQPDFNSEDQRMRNALGGAISAWSHVEAGLCEIFCVSITARNTAAAGAAFSAILGFEAQLDMVRAALTETYKKQAPVLSAWDKLDKQIDKLRPLRNRLAHGQIVRSRGPNFDETSFIPFHHFAVHKATIEYDHYTVADLKALERAFKLLGQALRQFYWHVFREEPLTEIPLEPVPQVGRLGFGRRRNGKANPSKDQTQTKPKPPPRASRK